MTRRGGTPDPPQTNDDDEHNLRIGEVAKLCGVTTRTLRYWEEIGLLAPSAQRHGSERVYSGSEVERAQRIRELQELVGFSLAEIRVVLETEDVLDKLRSAYKANARAELQRRLLANAMDANDKLVARLDDTLARDGLPRRTRRQGQAPAGPRRRARRRDGTFAPQTEVTGCTLARPGTRWRSGRPPVDSLAGSTTMTATDLDIDTNAVGSGAIVRTVDLTKVYAGTDFRAVDELNLVGAPRARSSVCSAPTAPARPRRRGCSPRG